MSGSGEVTYEYTAQYVGGGLDAEQLQINGTINLQPGTTTHTYNYVGPAPFQSDTSINNQLYQGELTITDQAFVTKFNTFNAYTIYSNVPLNVGQTYTLNTMADYNPCYRRGTRIRTAAGDVSVETLREGNIIVLANGATAPIMWLGHRKVNCARHPNPKSIWPILVREGAFGENLPARDLYVSPGHSILVGGVLMQAEKLVNGATILQVETDEVEYWHVELANHAIILAENLPAESYLDQGNRTAFANGGAFLEAHPDFRPKHWAQTCVPLVFEGPEMQEAKAALLARAAELGHNITHEDDLHIIADGKRFDPVDLSEFRQAFLLPAGARAISFHSRSFIPAQVSPKSGDKRALGVRLCRLALDGVDISLDDTAAFSDGWHKYEAQPGEPGARWTTGRTPLPANTRLVMIERAGIGHYWEPLKAAGGNVVALFN